MVENVRKMLVCFGKFRCFLWNMNFSVENWLNLNYKNIEENLVGKFWLIWGKMCNRFPNFLDIVKIVKNGMCVSFGRVYQIKRVFHGAFAYCWKLVWGKLLRNRMSVFVTNNNKRAWIQCFSHFLFLLNSIFPIFSPCRSWSARSFVGQWKYDQNLHDHHKIRAKLCDIVWSVPHRSHFEHRFEILGRWWSACTERRQFNAFVFDRESLFQSRDNQKDNLSCYSWFVENEFEPGKFEWSWYSVEFDWGEWYFLFSLKLYFIYFQSSR